MVRPVYFLAAGSHSLNTKMSPGPHEKSAKRSSNVFSPDKIWEKYFGQTFFLILTEKLLVIGIQA